MDSPQATEKATPLVDELPSLVGRTLGSSEWVTITQSAIHLFADATHDHQWIHTDPAAAEKGPFGRTIAHGFFTLSLSPWLLGQVLEVTNATSVVNYGLNKVRFPAPVPSGSRIRLTVALNDAIPVEGGIQAALGMTFEIEGSERPGCVAEMVVRYLA